MPVNITDKPFLEAKKEINAACDILVKILGSHFDSFKVKPIPHNCDFITALAISDENYYFESPSKKIKDHLDAAIGFLSDANRHSHVRCSTATSNHKKTAGKVAAAIAEKASSLLVLGSIGELDKAEQNRLLAGAYHTNATAAWLAATRSFLVAHEINMQWVDDLRGYIDVNHQNELNWEIRKAKRNSIKKIAHTICFALFFSGLLVGSSVVHL